MLFRKFSSVGWSITDHRFHSVCDRLLLIARSSIKKALQSGTNRLFSCLNRRRPNWRLRRLHANERGRPAARDAGQPEHNQDLIIIDDCRVVQCQAFSDMVGSAAGKMSMVRNSDSELPSFQILHCQVATSKKGSFLKFGKRWNFGSLDFRPTFQPWKIFFRCFEITFSEISFPWEALLSKFNLQSS